MWFILDDKKMSIKEKVEKLEIELEYWTKRFLEEPCEPMYGKSISLMGGMSVWSELGRLKGKTTREVE